MRIWHIMTGTLFISPFFTPDGVDLVADLTVKLWQWWAIAALGLTSLFLAFLLESCLDNVSKMR